ncbi:UNVERIFIED_ORG: hypothetical protein J3D59_004718 [Pseudomonas fluorescens]
MIRFLPVAQDGNRPEADVGGYSFMSLIVVAAIVRARMNSSGLR